MKRVRKPGLPGGAGAFIASILGALLLAGPLEHMTSGGAQAALGGAFHRAESMLGVSISYGKASPSILGSFALSSLQLDAADSRRLLRADRLDAAYNLPLAVASLLKTTPPGAALERIVLRNVELSLDLEKDSDLVDALRSLLRSGQGGSTASRPLEISARRVRIDIRDPSRNAVWTADIRSLDLVISEREVYVALDGSFSGVLNISGIPVRRVTVPVSLKGSATRNLTAARFTVSLAAKTDIGSLERQEFAVLLKEGVLEARKVRDDAPFDLYVKYDMNSGSLDAQTFFESLTLSRLGRPSGASAKSWSPWFGRPFTGHAFLRFSEGWKNPELELDVEGTLPPGALGDDFSFRIAAAGGLEKLNISKLQLRSPNGSALVTGSVRMDGTSVDLAAEIDYGALKGRLPIRTKLIVFGEGRELFLSSEGVEIGGVRLGKLSVLAARSSASLDFHGSLKLPTLGTDGFSGAFTPDMDSHSEDGKISWEGAITLGPSPYFESAVTIDSYDLEPLAPLLAVILDPSLGEFLKKLSLAGRVSFTSDFNRFSYSAADFRIAPSAKDGKDTYVVLNLSGTSRNLSISRFSASVGSFPVEGRLEAGFGEQRFTFDMDFSVQDIPYAIKGELEDGRLLATGDYGFSLLASRAESGLRGVIDFKSLPVSFPDGVLLATAEITGTLQSLEDWKLVIASLDLEPDSSLKGKIPRIHLAGTASPSGGTFPELSLEDERSRLQGTANFVWKLTEPDRRFRAELSLLGAAGEAVRANASFENGEIGGRADFQTFAVSHLLGSTVPGNLNGSLTVSGTAEDPRAEYSLNFQDGSVKGRAISFSAEGSLDRKILALKDGSIRYGVHQAQAVRGSLDLDTGSMSVAGAYAGFLAGDIARLRFEASGSFHTDPANGSFLPKFSGMLGNAGFRGQILDFSMGKNSASFWPFSLDLQGRELVFVGGEKGEVNIRVLEDRSFLARAVPPFPLSAIIVGKVADRQISMDLSDIRVELPVLWPLIPLPDVRFLSGTATGSLSVRGNASDPEIFGTLRFQDAMLEVPNYLNAPIGPVTAPLEAAGRQVSLVQPVAWVGQNARASVSLSFELSQWIPRSFSLRARSLESTQIPIRTRFLGMDIKGAAEADITLTAGENELGLSGSLNLPRAEVVIDPSILQSGNQEYPLPKVNTKIDLAVRIGKGVTVYFPSKEFPVIIGQADPSSRLTVSYDDKEESFALKGNAVLRGGNLFYIQRNFFLKNGKMTFNENQYSFDPRVTLEAELRTRNGNDNIKIILRAENASLGNFQPTMESVPSLSQAEIAALLGSELIASDEGTDVDLRRTLIASTDILPQLNFVNVFERNTRRLLGLDLFYLRTEIVQRWLLDVAKLDTNTTGGVTLADYLDNTSVFAGKYIRDDVFFHAMLQLQQDRPLVNKSSLRLDSEIGFELATPFFLFDWSLALLHPEDLFLSDNSFSFTWRLSY